MPCVACLYLARMANEVDCTKYQILVEGAGLHTALQHFHHSAEVPRHGFPTGSVARLIVDGSSYDASLIMA